MPVKLKDEKNIGRLENIKAFVKEKWFSYYELPEDVKRGPIVKIFGIPYTPHDDRHSQKVEKLLDELLPDTEIVDKTFSEDEKFLLLSAVWLHDIGMLPNLFPDDPVQGVASDEKMEEFKKNLRKKHAKRAADYIKKYGSDKDKGFGLLDQERGRLATICALHRKSDMIPRDLDDKIRLIIAYLRLADALHIPERAPVEELKEYLEFGMDPVSKYHWFKSFFVESVKPSEEEEKKFKIIIKFKKPLEGDGNVEKDMSPLVDILNTELRDELDAIKDIVNSEPPIN